MFHSLKGCLYYLPLSLVDGICDLIRNCRLILCALCQEDPPDCTSSSPTASSLIQSKDYLRLAAGNCFLLFSTLQLGTWRGDFCLLDVSIFFFFRGRGLGDFYHDFSLSFYNGLTDGWPSWILSPALSIRQTKWKCIILSYIRQEDVFSGQLLISDLGDCHSEAEGCYVSRPP